MYMYMYMCMYMCAHACTIHVYPVAAPRTPRRLLGASAAEAPTARRSALLAAAVRFSVLQFHISQQRLGLRIPSDPILSPGSWV